MYYFSEVNLRGNHAGTKARNDVEAILKKAGGKAINSKTLVLKSSKNEEIIFSNIQNRFGFIRFFLEASMLKGKKILIQYPMLSFDKDYDYLKKLAKRNELFFLVHDIHSMRRGDIDALKKEVEILNLAKGVILHNRFMEMKLLEYGLNVKEVYKLNIFDYLCENKPVDNKRNEKNCIVFAGNLSKSKFIFKLIQENGEVNINLYGNEIDVTQWPNTTYYGSFKPDALPEKLVGNYGLVWDGEEISSCCGFIGEYTKYNNPHKFSLYIAAGLPVIVWSKAAIAEVVRKNNIGIVVDNLYKLSDVLKKISDEEYLMMCKNVKKIREKVIAGENLLNILELIERN